MWSILQLEHRLRLITFISVGATVVGFLIVLGVAFAKDLNPLSLTGDSRGYILLAQNLLEHHVFSLSAPPFAPESFRAPGYPLFLAVLFALFGVSVFALFIQALIMSVAPILLYVLVRPYHERAAFWGSIVFAFEPVRLFLSASFLSDALFTVLFLASLVALEKGREYVSWKWIAGSGVLLGVMILVRPIAIFLPLAYTIYIAVSVQQMRQKIIFAGILGALTLTIVFPWMYRNHTVFDSWSISSVGNANLMLYNAPEFLKWKPDVRAQAILDSFNVAQASLARADALSLSRSEVFTETFREIIRGNEVSYVFFHVVKTIPFFVTDGLRDTLRLMSVDIGVMPNISTALMRGDLMTLFSYILSGGFPIALLVFGSGFWTMTTSLFATTSVRALIHRDLFPLFLAILIFYFAFLTGPVSNARYRVPVEGLMLILAMVALYRLKNSGRSLSQMLLRLRLPKETN